MTIKEEVKVVTEDSVIAYECGSKWKKVKAGSLTPMKAIRAKCLDCSGGSAKEVKLCVIPACPLFPFRLGMPDWKKRPVSAEECEARRKRAVERGLGTRINRQ